MLSFSCMMVFFSLFGGVVGGSNLTKGTKWARAGPGGRSTYIHYYHCEVSSYACYVMLHKA